MARHKTVNQRGKRSRQQRHDSHRILFTMFKNNRGDITFIELIELVLAFFVIVFFFIPLGTKVYRYFQHAPNQDIMHSVERLVTEIEGLSEQRLQKTMPFYLDDSYAIAAYNLDDNGSPLLCKKQSCLCIVDKQKRTTHSCTVVKVNFAKHNGLLVLETDTKGVFNVGLSMSNDENRLVTISTLR